MLAFLFFDLLKNVIVWSKGFWLFFQLLPDPSREIQRNYLRSSVYKYINKSTGIYLNYFGDFRLNRTRRSHARVEFSTNTGSTLKIREMRALAMIIIIIIIIFLLAEAWPITLKPRVSGRRRTRVESRQIWAV